MTDSKLGCRPAEGTAAQNRAETGYSRPSGQPWVAAWRPLPLKSRIRPCQCTVKIATIACRHSEPIPVTFVYDSPSECPTDENIVGSMVMCIAFMSRIWRLIRKVAGKIAGLPVLAYSQAEL